MTNMPPAHRSISMASMLWMRMPGQSWFGAAASFLGMWEAMMVAMMLPSLLPMLRRYRLKLAAADASHLNRSTAMTASGYFFVWALVGAAVYPLGAALCMLQTRQPSLSRPLSLAAAAIVVTSGALQFTGWKARRLACCRAVTFCAGPLSAWMAWLQGVRFGLQCNICCAGLTATLLVLGVMELRVMLWVTVAITLERVAPCGERIARVFGAVSVVAGLSLLSQA